MRRIVISLAILALPSLAQAAGLQVSGRAGYLSEWEIKATADETTVAGKKEFSGPLTLTHVGLCSVNGPTVKSGEIRFQTGPSSSWVKATLSFDGQKCTFLGTRSDTFDGIMDCPNTQGVPLSLTIK